MENRLWRSILQKNIWRIRLNFSVDHNASFIYLIFIAGSMLHLIRKLIESCIKLLLAISLTLYSVNASAEDRNAVSNDWLVAFKNEARVNQISEKTIEATLQHAKFLPRVIVLDRSQPEFISPFLTYLDTRVNTQQISQGRQMLQLNEALFVKVEAQYGVPKEMLVAFWGMETNYGKNKGNFGLPSALMTLAYEGRRSDFFRSQLLDVMRIVDAGHNHVSAMRGSWAGAMGHMQFMPSTFMLYGVDADQDGRINIWTSLEDAFASAANYLSQVGWRKNETSALEVKLPQGFQYQLAQLNTRKTSDEWAQLGVVAIDNSQLPKQDNAAILLPQGWQGPAFMVFSNFDAIMDWNRSVNYALSVNHLANQLKDDLPVVGGAAAEKAALSYNQLWALQTKLNNLGFDCGEPDGFPGLKTQTAIRAYQATQELPQDGFAGPSLYNRLMKQH